MHYCVFVFFGSISFISILLTTGKHTSFIILRGCETKVKTSILSVKSIPDCSKACAGYKYCDGFNYDKSTGGCHSFYHLKKKQGYMTLSDTITTVYKHKRTGDPVKVFSIHAGSNQSSVDLWHGRGFWSPPSYRNPLIGCWERLGVKNVTFVVHYGISKSERIYFDGSGSSSTSWFASNRIIESSLLKKSTAANKFSIDRDPWRHFFINQYYGGCQRDYGWVVIVDDHDTNYGCSWDNSTYYPLIMCASNARAINWNSNETTIASSVRILLQTSLLHN